MDDEKLTELVSELEAFLSATKPKEFYGRSAKAFGRAERELTATLYGSSPEVIEIIRTLAQMVIWQQEQLDDLEAKFIPYT